MMLSLTEDKWSTVMVMDQLWEDDHSDDWRGRYILKQALYENYGKLY